MPGFVHLRVTSCYSFLRGAGHPEAYLARAGELGFDTLGLCEEDYLCGLRRFEGAAKDAGIRTVLGGTVPTRAGPLPLLCRDREAYRRLCQLISRVHLKRPGEVVAVEDDALAPPSETAGLVFGEAEPEQPEREEPLTIRGGAPADAADLEAAAGDHFIVLTGGRQGRLAERLRLGDDDGAERWLRWLMDRFGRRQVVVELQRLGCLGDRKLSLQQVALARRLGLRYAATGDVRYPVREDFPVYDVMCCTRQLETVDTPFRGRPVNDLQYLASESAMRKRFADLPEAIDATVDIAAECDDIGLSNDRYVPCFNGVERAEQPVLLARLVTDGVMERYPNPKGRRKVFERVKEELRIIRALGLEGYFLLVWDVCRWARSQGIRCAGRGSAAGSVVCYSLRITNVDAFARDITPARFLNEERRESLPDIDVDFDREGRDKVIDYLVDRYGPDHVAMTGTYMRYHARSAIRDVGRALALPPEDVDRLAKSLPRIGADQVDGAEVKYPDVRESPWADQRYARLRELLPKLAGMPRHLGTHLGGVVITPEPLSDLIAVQPAGKPYRVVQGDKEDVEDRLCKFDCLCLPMFSVIEDANRFIKRYQPSFEIFDQPVDDPAVYARLQRSETIGAFEVGSPAQRALHARLHCDCFEPLIAALALIRPGPIKGNMVEHYLARRDGREPVDYWLAGLEQVLGKTYGVMVFQEQVIDVARIAGGLSPAEADLLRRSISHYRSEEAMQKLGESFCEKAVAKGLDRETADKIFLGVRGFAGYGFCESHAAAFADTAYRSVYLIEHYPAEYFAGLLRHQPMGFYPPHTLVSLAMRRGVKVSGPCVNSGPPRTESVDHAICVGLAQIKRIQVPTANRIVANRPYHCLGDLQRQAGLHRDQLAALIRAGACDSIAANRRMLLWQVQELPKHAPDETGRLALGPLDPPPDPRLPDFSIWDKVAAEWEMMGFAPTGHPVSFIRDELVKRRVTPCATFAGSEAGTRFRLAGLVLRPHRPPTRTGRNTLFFDLEDETGVVSVTCFKDVYQRDGHIALHNPVVLVEGTTDARAGLSLIADRLRPLHGPEQVASPHARTLY